MIIEATPFDAAFFVTGPTASGKTALAAEIARTIGGEIIGADAFQIYRELNLLSAKPSLELRNEIPHHLIDFVPVTESFDVARYLELALSAIHDILSRNQIPVVCGGTGLYVRALIFGLSQLPKANQSLREELEKLSLSELCNRYTALDPSGALILDTQNRRRLIRAIEVCELTGAPFSNFREEWSQPSKLHAEGLCLFPERDLLNERINARVVEMMNAGLAEEVAALPDSMQTADQAIGIRETRAFIKGELCESECVAAIQMATRRYAKRQRTWFRRESLFEPIHFNRETPIQIEPVLAHAERFASEVRSRLNFPKPQPESAPE